MWTNHENGPSPVEAGPVRVLPDVLDLVRVPADEPLGEVLVCPLDRLGVAFESAFAPADDALLSLDTHEEPSWGYAECLYVVWKVSFAKRGELLPHVLRSSRSCRETSS